MTRPRTRATTSGEPAEYEIEITAAHAGERADRALSALRPEVSRATFQRWIKEGRVSCEGRDIEASDRLPEGARVRVRPLPPPPSDARPEDIPLAVLFEDEHLTVIDKPAGMVVHPAPGHPEGTLVNALLHRFAATEDDEHALPAGDEPGASQRPGIVHRLDRDTSGVLVIARTAAAREGLMKLFAAHDIEREYVAIAEGLVPQRATFDTLHGRHPRDRKRFTTKVSRGKRAVTHIERIESLGGASLVRCRLETGRTHQIRVHLAEHGHPILGDRTYGRPPRDPRVRAVAETLTRHALHAEVLGLVHPITGARLHFRSPLPEALSEAVAKLRT